MEEYVARVIWNMKNNWIKPSGECTKSELKDSKNKEHGFGFDEWLLSEDFKIGDDIYSYIEGIFLTFNNSISKQIKLLVHTFYPGIGCYLIGKFNKCSILSSTESKNVFQYFQENSLIEQKRQDITAVNGDLSYFDKKCLTPRYIFNFKYHRNDLIILDHRKAENILSTDHKIKNYLRYRYTYKFKNIFKDISFEDIGI